jgi:uncharacterized protein YecE (DUF72 family)
LADIWAGCSGWNYAHWRGIFYPGGLPQREWLRFYAQHFLTAEINYSHYREPAESSWKNWRASVPDGFRFAVKAHRYLTHLRQLKDPEDSLRRVIEGAERLGPKLGPILYQLPPQFHRTGENVERLERFLGLLPRRRKHAFEFRHNSWFGDDTQDLLRRHGAGFCSHDMSGMDCPLVATAPFAYLRFHGPGARYAGRYTDDALTEWAGRIRELADGLEEVYMYFNNDMHGYAVENALTIARMLGAPLPAAATLEDGPSARVR